MLNEAQCWQAVQARDASYAGRFVYGVRTTGVYCRPSCSSRTPLRRNVRFFANPAEAELAGMRACVRCRPQPGAGPAAITAAVEEVRRFLDRHALDTSAPSMTDLARIAGFSVAHLQREFTAAFGMSPKEYVRAARVAALKGGLRAGKRVTDAAQDVGFSSSSRLHAAAAGELAMTPMEYRDGGRGLEIEHLAFDTPLGPALLAATRVGICWFQFGSNAEALLRDLKREYPNAKLAPAGEQSRMHAWKREILRMLETGKPARHLPLHLRGTVFQQRVWRELTNIPAGSTRSYTDIATATGTPTAVRAVAGACAANRVSVLVPCHRVLRTTGELGGYRWGLERKRALLAVEAQR